MSEEVYEQLCQYWQSEKFQKISKAAKENRKKAAEVLGGPVHTGGSISFPEHEMRMVSQFFF